ncbi:hypothetical protein SAMN05216573_103589 [Bradyrhizobium sp. Rc3b]|nr:hypothetical protein SAMN05216573_103589 [Bradyrhizobium sp. Rc3b]
MMAHRMTMTMAVPMSTAMSTTMPALGQGRTGECESGCKDQRRGERKFLHMSSTGASALVRSINERPVGKFPANVEES